MSILYDYGVGGIFYEVNNAKRYYLRSKNAKRYFYSKFAYFYKSDILISDLFF